MLEELKKISDEITKIIKEDSEEMGTNAITVLLSGFSILCVQLAGRSSGRSSNQNRHVT